MRYIYIYREREGVVGVCERHLNRLYCNHYMVHKDFSLSNVCYFKMSVVKSNKNYCKVIAVIYDRYSMIYIKQHCGCWWLCAGWQQGIYVHNWVNTIFPVSEIGSAVFNQKNNEFWINERKWVNCILYKTKTLDIYINIWKYVNHANVLIKCPKHRLSLSRDQDCVNDGLWDVRHHFGYMFIWCFNSLAPRRFENRFKILVLKLLLRMGILSHSCEIALQRMLQKPFQ